MDCKFEGDCDDVELVHLEVVLPEWVYHVLIYLQNRRDLVIVVVLVVLEPKVRVVVPVGEVPRTVFFY